jgi:hypothetical protein
LKPPTEAVASYSYSPPWAEIIVAFCSCIFSGISWMLLLSLVRSCIRSLILSTFFSNLWDIDGAPMSCWLIDAHDSQEPSLCLS